MRFVRTALAAGLLVWSQAGFAAECDCAQHVGSCSATGTLDLTHQVINFRAATQECAQITYTINGEPSSVTIKGGEGAADYLVTNPNAHPQLAVESCSVCAASSAPAGHLSGPALTACTDACQATNDAGANQCLANPDTYLACVTPVSKAGLACIDRCFAPR